MVRRAPSVDVCVCVDEKVVVVYRHRGWPFIRQMPCWQEYECKGCCVWTVGHFKGHYGIIMSQFPSKSSRSEFTIWHLS